MVKMVVEGYKTGHLLGCRVWLHYVEGAQQICDAISLLYQTNESHSSSSKRLWHQLMLLCVNLLQDDEIICNPRAH